MDTKKTIGIMAGIALAGGLVGANISTNDLATEAVAETITIEKTSDNSVKVIKQEGSKIPAPVEQDYSQEYIEIRKVELEQKIIALDEEKKKLNEELDFLATLESRIKTLKVSEKETIK